MTQGKVEKDILSTASELGTQLASYHLEEAWTTAGRLHNLLKSEEVIHLPADQLEAIRNELKGYYLTNGEVSRLQKQLAAKGHKLQELSNK
ncbi:hypothetical protein CCE06_08675 [Streptococcus agalactiae]|uniref:hypothetical protein n=1 Tax=Streptococcus agalactiae TaxID=1311 RepID=UPI000BA83F56|nr:hypothetical protein [Streptococcus agalactiae]PAO73890.1 hypothetical protein CCE06_08675 [Streptococcus agalactiae]